MDDQRFDDSLKSKVGDYEDSGFDPAALAALHHQMAAALVVPWYSLYRTELLIGSGIVASTLIILLSQWFMNTNAIAAMDEKIIILQAQQEEISNLQNQLSLLRNAPPDTIRIIEIREQPSSNYTSLLYRLRLLEAEAARRDVVGNAQNENSESSYGLVGKDYFTGLNFNESQSTSTAASYRNSFPKRLSPKEKEKESAHAEPDNSALVVQSDAKNLSANTLRDLEKHYQKGIGIRVGPTVEFAKGFYSEGTQGDIALTYGVLGDFILSPSLSIETGVKYSKRYYDISDTDALLGLPLPGDDQSPGTLQIAEIDSWMFEIPVALKYRYPLSLKTHLLGSIGYSSLLYRKQIFEYDHLFPSGGDAYTLASEYESSKTSFYSGSLNITLGISKKLKNNEILETSLYYQYGIGEKGIEKTNVNFLGVRGVYWFTVR